MECNKEEAIRAKEIAEKKLLSNDFRGARKMAMKAKNLFPELDNISQILAVCDVHCAAQNNMCGNEKDWYGILQIERLADDATIKKQYRKLALVLHPDKNQFHGAEAAFKLIGEANMVLSDKGKRSLHDMRSRISSRTVVTTKPPSQKVNLNPVVRNSHPNISTSRVNISNQSQPTQSDMLNGRQVFWTCCPFCVIKYQYYKDFVNRALRCPNCSKSFIAYDLGAHGAPPVSNKVNLGSEGSIHGLNRGQPSLSKQKQVPKMAFKMGAQSTGEFPSHFGSEATSSRKVGPEHVMRAGGTIDVGGGSKNKVKGNAHINGGVGMSKGKSGNSGGKNRKRRRKFVVDSSESFDTGSSSDGEEVVFGRGGDNQQRRSSRQKQNVSYNENASDDDFMSPRKRSRESKANDDTEEKEELFNNEEVKAETNEKELKQKRSVPADDVAVKYQVRVQKVVTLDPGATKSNAMNDSESKTNLGPKSEPEFYVCLDPDFYDCPDPEFSDFDKDKEEKCFSVNQIWACYDTIDGMPRFYAQVKKVCSPGFKLRFTWLEADPEDQAEIDWVNEGLPVGCGKFVHGNTEETTDRLTFSHQIHFEKGNSRGSYMIYPRIGETWALYKDWDIGWSSDPENHKNYVFAIVEILSDFDRDSGIKVGQLAKMEGYVSLFQRTTRGDSTFHIPSGELLRFSHRVPSFKMTGNEREGVPEGSFELDPASLPTNPNEIWQPEEVKVKSSTNSKKTSTPKKSVDFDKETPVLRRSPRESSSSTSKKHDQDGTAKQLNGSTSQTVDCGPSQRKASTDQADEEIHIGMARSPIDLTESPGFSPAFTVEARVSEEIFYNFNRDKSEGKFQPGQIWALYSGKEKLPYNYVQIKKIEPSPFRLHAALLEPFTSMQPISCGMFRVQNRKPSIFSPISFSHLMKVTFISKTKLEIYPSEGEIWAIYKNWNAELSSSDLEKSGFDIVEVIKSDQHCIEVSCLVHLSGFKSVFKARRRRSNIGVLEIPKAELSRFSHQIPAFQLTGEKDGVVRGCWELDPAALPGHMLHKKEDG